MHNNLVRRWCRLLQFEFIEQRLNLASLAFVSQMSPLTPNGMAFLAENSRKADLDGDGDEDFVVEIGESRLYWYEKTGPESFTAHQFQNPSLTSVRSLGVSNLEFEVIDMNHDDVPDVVTSGGKSVTVFLGEPDKGPTLVGMELGVQVATVSEITSDFNGDGRPDLLTFSESGLQVLVNHLDDRGGMEVADAFPRFTPFRILDADLDLDLDIVFAGRVMVNDGDARFSENITDGVPDLTGYFDVDEDGDADIVAQRDTTLVWYEVHNGLVDLTQQRHVTDLLERYWRLEDIDNDSDLDFLQATESGLELRENLGVAFSDARLLSDQFVLSFEVFDMDEDGDSDISVQAVTSNQVESLWIENRLSNGFETRPISFTPIESLATDVDEDGDLDFISGPVWYDSVIDTTPIPIFSPFPAETTRVADIDGDGRLDIYGTIGVDTVWVRNLGDLRFSSPHLIAKNGALVPGDIDGDGDLDFLRRIDHRMFSVLEQRVGSQFVEHPIEFRILARELPQLVDVDADGDLDILVGRRIGIYENQGDFVFGEFIQISGSTSLLAVQVTDLEDDGTLDVFGFRQGELVSFELDFESRKIVETQRLETRWTSESSILVDIDGDDLLDLVSWSNSGNVMFFGNEGGRFKEPITVGQYDVREDLGAAWDVEPADVDSDGDIDLLVASSRGRYVFAWYENLDSRGTFAPMQQLLLDNSLGDFLPRGIVSADFDSDGELEFLLENAQGVDLVQRSDKEGILIGDNNHDGELDVADIDEFCQPSAVDSLVLSRPRNFDYNSNFQVNHHDFDTLVERIVGAVPGDVNFDGIFNSADLVAVWQAGRYEDSLPNALWSEGDWNCDRNFDSRDLVFAFEAGAFHQVARKASLAELAATHRMRRKSELESESRVERPTMLATKYPLRPIEIEQLFSTRGERQPYSLRAERLTPTRQSAHNHVADDVADHPCRSSITNWD